jgi:hypothetical protein
MIESASDLPPGTLGFRASGKVTSDEYREMMAPIYAALDRVRNSISTSNWQMTFTASTGAHSFRM